ncbi:MAG: sodium:calcium antiporter [Candidatus Omnitrophota bacterium]
MIIWIKFIICVLIILFSGRRVAKYGDVIAEKTGLGGLWVGVILISVITSLPELFTGIGSSTLVNAPDLTIGNLFGANRYNMVNIALLDFLHRGTPLLSVVSLGQLLTAGLTLIIIAIAAVGIFLSSILPDYDFFNISIYSILILVAYILSTRIIFKFERDNKNLAKVEEDVFKYKNIPLSKACYLGGIFAILIAGAGIWLSYIGLEIAREQGLSQSFVGSILLGFATTLPEITVSVAALRLGARDMAVANLMGSNLFNIFIIFINDALYRKAPIFSSVSPHHIFNALANVIMTAVIIISLIVKPKRKFIFGLSSYSIILILLFIVSAIINFSLGAN